MILNYWRMVERYLSLKEEAGSSNPECEISSLLDIKTYQVVNCLMCFDSGLSALYLPKKKKEKREIQKSESTKLTSLC